MPFRFYTRRNFERKFCVQEDSDNRKIGYFSPQAFRRKLGIMLYRCPSVRPSVSNFRYLLLDYYTYESEFYTKYTFVPADSPNMIKIYLNIFKFQWFLRKIIFLHRNVNFTQNICLCMQILMAWFKFF